VKRKVKKGVKLLTQVIESQINLERPNDKFKLIGFAYVYWAYGNIVLENFHQAVTDFNMAEKLT